MKVIALKSRGQNITFSTEDATSFVVRGDLVELGFGTEVQFDRDALSVVIKDKTFSAWYDEHNNVYDLSEVNVSE